MSYGEPGVNDDYVQHLDEMSRCLYHDERKGHQIWLTVSEFRGNYYLGLRKWVQDLEGEWIPTKQGFSWPYNLETTTSLFSGLCSILSEAEVLQEVFNESKKPPTD